MKRKISIVTHKQFILIVSIFFCLAIQAASSAAQAASFSLQCSENERISRIVVRTDQNRQLQFMGIECKKPNGARRIFKAGIEEGVRHEILTPKQISEVHIKEGICQGDSFSRPKLCAISFRFDDATETSNFGASLRTGTNKVLKGNGEIYGIAGDFRRRLTWFNKPGQPS
jgi:hypothetical protein